MIISIFMKNDNKNKNINDNKNKNLNDNKNKKLIYYLFNID